MDSGADRKEVGEGLREVGGAVKRERFALDGRLAHALTADEVALVGDLGAPDDEAGGAPWPGELPSSPPTPWAVDRHRFEVAMERLRDHVGPPLDKPWRDRVPDAEFQKVWDAMAEAEAEQAREFAAGRGSEPPPATSYAGRPGAPSGSVRAGKESSADGPERRSVGRRLAVVIQSVARYVLRR
jgi:hypothetical protein